MRQNDKSATRAPTSARTHHACVHTHTRHTSLWSCICAAVACWCCAHVGRAVRRFCTATAPPAQCAARYKTRPRCTDRTAARCALRGLSRWAPLVGACRVPGRGCVGSRPIITRARNPRRTCNDSPRTQGYRVCVCTAVCVRVHGGQVDCRQELLAGAGTDTPRRVAADAMIPALPSQGGGGAGASRLGHRAHHRAHRSQTARAGCRCPSDLHRRRHAHPAPCNLPRRPTSEDTRRTLACMCACLCAHATPKARRPMNTYAYTRPREGIVVLHRVHVVLSVKPTTAFVVSDSGTALGVRI